MVRLGISFGVTEAAATSATAATTAAAAVRRASGRLLNTNYETYLTLLVLQSRFGKKTLKF